MSRQSGAHIDKASGTISGLRPWTVTKPVAKQLFDFRVARLGMTPPEILAHQIKPGVEQNSNDPLVAAPLVRFTFC
jgi:hypothetical protein